MLPLARTFTLAVGGDSCHMHTKGYQMCHSSPYSTMTSWYITVTSRYIYNNKPLHYNFNEAGEAAMLL